MHTDPKLDQILSLSHCGDETTRKRRQEFKLQVDWELVIPGCFIDHRFWSGLTVVQLQPFHLCYENLARFPCKAN